MNETPLGQKKDKEMKIFSSFIIAFILVFTFLNSQTPDSLKVGDLAPNWSLKTIDGKLEFLHNWTVKNNRQLRKPTKQPNRHVVVLAFFGTWCPPCVKQLNPLEKVHQRFKDDEVKFFIIDNTEYLRKNPPNGWDGIRNAPYAGELFNEMNINIEALDDKYINVSKKYDIKAVPKIFVIDRSQVIRDITVGYEDNDDSKLVIKLSKIIEELLE